MMNVEAWQLWVSAAGVLLSFGVGIAQCSLIWAGLKQMRAASESRDRQMDKQHAETMQALNDQREAQEHESQRRHAENMRALEAIIERTGGGATAS